MVRPFDIPHHAQFRQFSYFPFDINQFRRFDFSIFISNFSDSRKFGSSTYESSFIFESETSDILKLLLLEISTLIPLIILDWNLWSNNGEKDVEKQLILTRGRSETSSKCEEDDG